MYLERTLWPSLEQSPRHLEEMKPKRRREAARVKRREKEIECEIERLRDGKRVREREKKIEIEIKMERE